VFEGEGSSRGPRRNPELAEDVGQVAGTLFLVLGGVALLIGGLGIANIALLSVLERVSEIGLRRAVGATRPHVGRGAGPVVSSSWGTAC
jgi:putative ABC transport system permease protein